MNRSLQEAICNKDLVMYKLRILNVQLYKLFNSQSAVFIDSVIGKTANSKVLWYKALGLLKR